MPRVQSKIEGRGNGIKTVIPNMPDIAKALNCPPEFPTKFFGIELGAQSKWEAKSERAIVNGEHHVPALQPIMTKFIEMFILCPRCGLPEIKWKVTKSAIKIDCAACGHNGQINTAHRLLQFILKQKSAKKKGKGSTKAERRARKMKNQSSGKVSSKKDEEEEEEEQVEWFTDTSKEAVEERKKKEFEKMTAGRKVSSVSSKDNPIVVLRDFISSNQPTVAQILAELKRLQVARGFNESEKLKILLESSVETSNLKEVTKEFQKRAPLFKEAVTNAQEQKLFLLCLEELVGTVEKKLLPRTPMLLQTLYDLDIIEEEQITEWAESPPETGIVPRDVATEVRKAAGPFVTWLKEAEEEDDE
eukprot:CAMPEP_0114519100 /NCGR_PEP_ID=MMETSP0109-20121206/18813_1 /TAXON_ID=29199 /ORGANISM="Chlorarachnion reptans, Strain CCCM449" /LENGTH=359 /DNA_ID=CAMNT_0001699797 /DNA_START=219 /DNA_END=1298 /DNA_ORIENTATION=-